MTRLAQNTRMVRSVHPYSQNNASCKERWEEVMSTKTLFFNVKVNLRRGSVLGYLLTIKFHL
jgi:hypothetical protein